MTPAAVEKLAKRRKSWKRVVASLEDVDRLTTMLMRKFDGRHHRFLIDYGWRHVAEYVLKHYVPKPRRRKKGRAKR